MKKLNLIQRSALNSLGVLAYIAFISLILNNGEKIFGSMPDKIISPIFFLLLFVFSALLTGGLILGKPIMLYLDGAKKEAIKLLAYTGASLFIILLVCLVVMILVR